MKLIKVFTLLLLVSNIIYFSYGQTITQSNISSGYSNSNNSEYIICGTIGNSIEGNMDNSSYILESGFESIVKITTSILEIPLTFELYQNYPNPLNPTTTISYELPEAQNITLQIFDITGRLVETLYNGYKEAGNWDVTWDANDQSSGVYIYRLTYRDKQISRKMVVLK